jgi:hypothetical protein
MKALHVKYIPNILFAIYMGLSRKNQIANQMKLQSQIDSIIT